MSPTFNEFTYVINYNSNFNSDSNKNMEFININLLYNKISIQLFVNSSITFIKKGRVLETEKKANKLLKAKIT